MKTVLFVGLAAAVIVAVGVARGMGSSTETDDPCMAVMNASPGAADPLASAGLGGRSVSAQLLQDFVPVNVTCAGRITPSESYVRGVFLELRDGSGTAAVYVALHPRDESQTVLWHEYLQETFGSSLVFDERGDGSLLAVIPSHPRSAAALAAYRKTDRATPLWEAVAEVIAQ